MRLHLTDLEFNVGLQILLISFLKLHPIFVAEIMLSNTEWDGYHFADDNFIYIFLTQNLYIMIHISLRFACKSSICKRSSLLHKSETTDLAQYKDAISQI